MRKVHYEAFGGSVYIRERGEDPSKIADCENGDQGVAEAIAGCLNLCDTMTDAQVATAQERIDALEAKCVLLAACLHKAEAERGDLLEACRTSAANLRTLRAACPNHHVTLSADGAMVFEEMLQAVIAKVTGGAT